MKRVLIIMTMLCFVFTGGILTSFAEDLVCNPNPTADRYRVLGLDPARTIQPAEADGSVKYNVDTLAPGTYNATIEAGAAYTLDGVAQTGVKWSTPPTPFELGVPDVAAPSSGLAVEK